jgi:hypothetical protein
VGDNNIGGLRENGIRKDYESGLMKNRCGLRKNGVGLR